MGSAKRLAACAVIAGLALSPLAACGDMPSSSSEKDSSGATVVKFGINVANPKNQEPATYAIVRDFNERNKGKYHIKFEAADTESHNKNMKLEASNNSLPEIFWVDSSQVSDFQDAGVLLNLHDFLSKNKTVKKALDGSEKAFRTKDGFQYGLPYQSNVQGIFYNKEIFDKVGIPYPNDATTFDDLLAAVKTIRDKGITPISIGSKNSSYAMWEFNLWLARYGWSKNIEAVLGKKKQLSKTEIPKAFSKIYELASARAFPTNMSTQEYFDAKQQFDSGKAAMFGSGQWDCAEFNKNLGNKIGFWWGPKFGDTKLDQNYDMKVPSAPLAVSAAVKDNPKVKAATMAFLAFYYSKRAAQISYDNSMFPATNYKDVMPARSNYAMTAMVNAMANGYPSPETAPDQGIPSDVQQALYDALFGVMQKTYTPEQAVAKVQDSITNS